VKAVMSPTPDRLSEALVIPLPVACGNARLHAALAFLTAGTRVNLAGDIGGTGPTIADGARRNHCKHRDGRVGVAA
jgi:hypothetical protein